MRARTACRWWSSTKAARSSVPGRLVARWGPGNWSGSEDAKLRTIRSGAALQKSHGKRFLIYAVFSDATPSAMARVFQAYRCDYAMLLDMNALEHTYLRAVSKVGIADMSVDHLIKGMSEVDKSCGFRRAAAAVSGLSGQPGFLLRDAARRPGGQTMRILRTGRLGIR